MKATAKLSNTLGLFTISGSYNTEETNLFSHFKEVSWSMEAARGEIERDWLSTLPLILPGINAPNAPLLSNGKKIGELEGECCLIPKSFIVAKNI